jgi:hypothetical protein
VRDSDGVEHQIDKIVRHSELEDVIMFTLKTYPKNMVPLKLQKKTEVGDDVFTVGNANGEGIVERPGRVTSFSPESRYGKFKHIRFTAPASPGNSGGALINSKGQAIGVVTMKSSNENLNYAVPMSQVLSLPKEKALFENWDIQEVEGDLSLNLPWKAEFKLPDTLDGLSTKAWKSMLQSVKTQRAEFVEKFKDKVFPFDKKIPGISVLGATSDVFFTLGRKGDGTWGYYRAEKHHKFDLGDDRSLIFSASRLGSDLVTDFHFEKPKEMKLADFVLNDKEIFDTISKVLKLSVPLGSKRIPVKSLGNPFAKESWRDTHGRVWRISTYKFEVLDTAIINACTAVPYGLSCKSYLTKYWSHPMMVDHHKEWTERTVFGFVGKPKEWADFLALDKSLIPPVFQTAKFQWKDGKFDLKLDKESYSLNLKELQANNQPGDLAVGFIHDNQNLLSSKFTMITFVPEKLEKNRISFYRAEGATSNTSEADRDYLEKYFIKQKKDDIATDNEVGVHYISYFKNDLKQREPTSNSSSYLRSLYCAVDKTKPIEVAKVFCEGIRKASGF